MSRASRFRARRRRSQRCGPTGIAFASSPTTRRGPARSLAEELRGIGIELDEEEIATTPSPRAGCSRASACSRSTMSPGPGRPRAVRPARRGGRGGRAPREAPTRPRRPAVFSYERLNEAFAAARGGARLVCLHEPLVADVARPAARRRRLRRRARVRRGSRGGGRRQADRGLLRRRPRASSTREPRRRSWSGTTSRPDIGGAKAAACGRARPHGQVPARGARGRRPAARRASSTRSPTCPVLRATDERSASTSSRSSGSSARSSATRGSASACSRRASAATATRARTRPSTTPPASPARRPSGKALGFGVARAFAWKDVEIAGRPKPEVQPVRPGGRLGAARARARSTSP